ncbi:MAG TPA: amino acid permease [Chthoniobacteraceae bacterium]|nr:amino acid permease [Chthoniobacteraceae bacterium]
MNPGSSGNSQISLLTATCIVVANMVGTGVFTSLGFQVGGLPSGFALLVLWLVGGVCALCGALAYAELAAALPRSGGEYHLVGRTVHPAAGFLAGWLSATVGFAAPIALAAMALGKYFSGIIGSEAEGGAAKGAALAAVVLITLIHLRGIRLGAIFQNVATIFKLTLIAVALGAGFAVTQTQPISFAPLAGDGARLLSAPFATSLVYVMYAHTGWNAATYIVGEIREPARNVPRALLLGTGLVAVLYIGLNAVFLRTTPVQELSGNLEVGLIAGRYIFGPTGGNIIGGFICLGLLATISAMTWVGPRVAATMGEDLAFFRPLAVKGADGVPTRALLVQFALVVLLIITSSFSTVLNYVQFALTLCSMITVVGLFILRWREPNLPRPFKVPLYPLPPLIFLAISGWMLVFMLRDPQQQGPSLIGLGLIGAGLILYFLSPKTTRPLTS